MKYWNLSVSFCRNEERIWNSESESIKHLLFFMLKWYFSITIMTIIIWTLYIAFWHQFTLFTTPNDSPFFTFLQIENSNRDIWKYCSLLQTKFQVLDEIRPYLAGKGGGELEFIKIVGPHCESPPHRPSCRREDCSSGADSEAPREDPIHRSHPCIVIILWISVCQLLREHSYRTYQGYDVHVLSDRCYQAVASWIVLRIDSH